MSFLLAHLSDAHIGPIPRPNLAELLGKRATGYVNWLYKRAGQHDMGHLARDAHLGELVELGMHDDQVDAEVDRALSLCDSSTPYALTGAVFAQDRVFLEKAARALRHAAGNFYVNDKPTGAVVGQQPFGGARASGTNDKAGSKLNLIRWVSTRTMKETFVPPTDYKYPFMSEE